MGELVIFFCSGNSLVRNDSQFFYICMEDPIFIKND